MCYHGRDDFFMTMIMTMMTVVEKAIYKSSSVCYHGRDDFFHDNDHDEDDGGGKSII